MHIKIGDYRVLLGNSDVPFWRLVPGTTIDDLLSDNQCAPNDQETWNTLTLPVPFGIFDIVIRMSEPVLEQELTDALSIDLLTHTLSGQPDIGPMVMWDEGIESTETRVANISFAIRIPSGQNFFEGILELVTQNADSRVNKTVRLPIRVGEYKRAADMFVFFIANPRVRPPNQRYCWIKSQVFEWAFFSGPLPQQPGRGFNVDVKILRDNFRQGFNKRNRRVSLLTDAQGFACYRHTNGDRPVVALPIQWPIILTATQAGYVRRAHLIRLEHGDIDHNQNPHQLSAIEAISISSASTFLRTKTVLTDPGHGVVYGLAGARRSQEWFVAHKIATQIGEILRNRFHLPPNNFFMTRTAGFGLIDPDEMDLNDAPERGARRFAFDLTNSPRRLRIRQGALGLVDLSNLVLTGDDDTPANITAVDRNRLITNNNTTIATIIQRIDNTLRPGRQRVQPNSVRWHADTNDYVYRIEEEPPRPLPHAPPPRPPRIIEDTRHFPIQTTDWFDLDDAMLGNLAHRSARWSIEHEIGGNDIHADGASGRASFPDAARAAMRSKNAEDYMRQKIIEELRLEQPYLAGATTQPNYINKETMGWHPIVRRNYINRKKCDIAISTHENAMGPNALNIPGMAMLVGRNPPDDQVRTAKLFMKYVDPFDQGLRSGGVATNGAAQLTQNNRRRATHAYFELEFMTSTILNNPGVRAADGSRYQYQAMVEDAFINTVAEQIVAGIVEFLVDPQSDIDGVTYHNGFPKW
ncbi:MAG: hypothetical protein KDJ34_10760 [Candidatus Competibacteraceae bacterium]|nr:hypothetical protein [Candidatus Competibacteraceae bacterium]